jgi:hypothetical protein
MFISPGNVNVSLGRWNESTPALIGLERDEEIIIPATFEAQTNYWSSEIEP